MRDVRTVPNDGSVWERHIVADRAEIYTSTEGLTEGLVHVVAWTDLTVHDHPAYMVSKGTVDVNELDMETMRLILGSVSNTYHELAVDAVICFPVDEVGLTAEVHDDENTSHDEVYAAMVELS
ncbi:DNA repair protein [Bacillus phage Bobb]|uniref:DNA repair protein n=1 Tax=Bacillus phage Bobb TaxID=1527469 RepID=A0A076G957_9CAUD|nr:hypothetical protein LD13_gp006 [Bacillus phage Bobb]YP_009056516.1 DNA repair protein [Bacillus phage Bobb]AII27907.1 hypothetical protein [Bacillus phage Bobb]AII28148.1 DNA repair protein [Bacillus phage Bobb]